MNFGTFILLIIAIAVGVSLGTGRLSVDDLILFLWKTLAELIRGAFWLLIFAVPLVVSYLFISYLWSFFNINLNGGDLTKQIITWIASLTIAGYSVMLFYNIKSYGLKKGVNKTFEDTSTPSKPKPELDWDNLTNEDKKFVKKTKTRYWLLTVGFFAALGIPLILMAAIPSFTKTFNHSGLGIIWMVIFFGLGIYWFIWTWKMGRKINKLPKKIKERSSI